MNDVKNRFAKNDSARQSRREETSRAVVAEHQAQVAEDRATWHGSRRTDNRVGGTLLDVPTVRAKRDRDDDLAAGRARKDSPIQPLSPASMEAITRDWLAQRPEFYNSEFNRTSMRNFVRRNVEENGILFGFELLDAGFVWLAEHNHLEKAPGIVRKRGDIVSQAAPTIFEYAPAEEREAHEQLARQVAESIEDAEAERAKNMPLEDLQKEIRTSRKPLTREQASAVVL
jgi:hypothetical protein